MNTKTKIYSTIFITLLVFVFTGCASSTFNEMKQNYEKKEFVIKQNYQVLYKRALDKSRECHETGLLTAAMVADGNLYPQLNQGQISIYLIGGLGKSMIHGASFNLIDNTHTKMIIYSRYGGEWFDVLKKEFTGECKNCLCEDEK